MKSIKMKSNN